MRKDGCQWLGIEWREATCGVHAVRVSTVGLSAARISYR
jgi:hypothetical protein